MTYILSFSVCRERMLEVYFQVVVLFVLYKALQALTSTRECCWLHTTTELLQGVEGSRFPGCPGSRRVFSHSNRAVPRLNHTREKWTPAQGFSSLWCTIQRKGSAEVHGGPWEEVTVIPSKPPGCERSRSFGRVCPTPGHTRLCLEGSNWLWLP